MGQAKKRGTLEQRISQAVSRQLDEPPIDVPCSTCNAVLNGFTLLRTGPAGAAWQKTCECGAITTALVQAKDSTLERTFKSCLAMTGEITDPSQGNKVSVRFLEKSPETIETGLIRLN